MTIRVFSCPRCGHRMRLTGSTCHACLTPKPIFERLGVLIGVVLVIAGVAWKVFG